MAPMNRDGPHHALVQMERTMRCAVHGDLGPMTITVRPRFLMDRMPALCVMRWHCPCVSSRTAKRAHPVKEPYRTFRVEERARYWCGYCRTWLPWAPSLAEAEHDWAEHCRGESLERRVKRLWIALTGDQSIKEAA